MNQQRFWKILSVTFASAVLVLALYVLLSGQPGTSPSTVADQGFVEANRNLNNSLSVTPSDNDYSSFKKWAKGNGIELLSIVDTKDGLIDNPDGSVSAGGQLLVSVIQSASIDGTMLSRFDYDAMLQIDHELTFGENSGLRPYAYRLTVVDQSKNVLYSGDTYAANNRKLREAAFQQALTTRDSTIDEVRDSMNKVLSDLPTKAATVTIESKTESELAELSLGNMQIEFVVEGTEQANSVLQTLLPTIDRLIHEDSIVRKDFTLIQVSALSSKGDVVFYWTTDTMTGRSFVLGDPALTAATFLAPPAGPTGNIQPRQAEGTPNPYPVP